MKNWYKMITAIFLGMFILAGCSAAEQDEIPNKDVSETAQITISIEEEIIAEKDIEINEEKNLMDLLEENFEIESDEGFITSIEGYEQNVTENKYWLYNINGEPATTGANDYQLKPGDDIVFNLGNVE
ncbi:protein of unknown function [Gracilibacillus ureilyticus]|uniref:Transcobalamin-like C-terminal domain-containing protein n=1 Tax=Gracilibacillus ureilyticus TaxID=531814 RepID=A0A1H9LRY9_9BACI|nr:DUF4430 domain-containing protein [Gracilibacillus ureilyticus]SER14231.1 protein of unknown function [Gracilibacillus ureilyticus]